MVHLVWFTFHFTLGLRYVKGDNKHAINGSQVLTSAKIINSKAPRETQERLPRALVPVEEQQMWMWWNKKQINKHTKTMVRQKMTTLGKVVSNIHKTTTHFLHASRMCGERDAHTQAHMHILQVSKSDYIWISSPTLCYLPVTVDFSRLKKIQQQHIYNTDCHMAHLFLFLLASTQSTQTLLNLMWFEVMKLPASLSILSLFLQLLQ